jgi:uncharacterized NAD-dependent epimerase/dehydratase family protein
VVAIAVNTSLIASEEEARAEVARIAAETGLPADDPVRFGGARLWREIQRAVDALPAFARVPAAASNESGR